MQDGVVNRCGIRRHRTARLEGHGRRRQLGFLAVEPDVTLIRLDSALGGARATGRRQSADRRVVPALQAPALTRARREEAR